MRPITKLTLALVLQRQRLNRQMQNYIKAFFAGIFTALLCGAFSVFLAYLFYQR
jgi:hypothetical protein